MPSVLPPVKEEDDPTADARARDMDIADGANLIDFSGPSARALCPSGSECVGLQDDTDVGNLLDADTETAMKTGSGYVAGPSGQASTPTSQGGGRPTTRLSPANMRRLTTEPLVPSGLGHVGHVSNAHASTGPQSNFSLPKHNKCYVM